MTHLPLSAFQVLVYLSVLVCGLSPLVLLAFLVRDWRNGTLW